MRKTMLALATAGAFAGTTLPALAWDRDDDGHQGTYGTQLVSTITTSVVNQ
jgi:hypothetical protein